MKTEQWVIIEDKWDGKTPWVMHTPIGPIHSRTKTRLKKLREDFKPKFDAKA